MARAGTSMAVVVALLVGAVGGAWLRGAAPASHAALFDRVAPWVVNVTVDAPEVRVGSGFAVAPDEVLTALHIVESATAMVVRGVAGPARAATPLGSDARPDLALLRDAGGGLPAAPLGRSDRLRVGDPVVAIGNPYGLGHSLSAGYVGHRGRRLSAEADAGPRVDFIQLSIPLNPGNSGGPVFDAAGGVIGVLSGTHAQGQAIAFAVPVEVVADALPAMRAGRHVSRAFFGARADVGPGGLVVAAVTPHGPADRAGLRVGDGLRAFGGRPVADRAALQAVLDASSGGERVELSILRDGAEQVIPVTLADWAEQPVVTAGMTLRAEPGSGGEVVAVRPRSRAEAAGVVVGDRVRAVDGVPARAPADVKDALSDGGAAQLELVRGGVPIAVQLGDAG